MMNPPRIGAVPYLNALPLCRFLKLPIRYEVPSTLEKLILAGEIDIALLSSFTFLANPTFKPLYDAGLIQSDGPVESVLLFYRDTLPHPSQMRTVSLTPESRTSVSLFWVLWQFAWDRPANSLRVIDGNADGFLEIGDRALFQDRKGYKVLDLGEAWKDWTGLPFVFAFWIAREEVPLNIRELLQKSKIDGLAAIDKIITEVKDWPEERVRHYLTRSILYEKTCLTLKSLSLFQDYCVKAGLLKNPRELQ